MPYKALAQSPGPVVRKAIKEKNIFFFKLIVLHL